MARWVAQVGGLVGLPVGRAAISFATIECAAGMLMQRINFGEQSRCKFWERKGFSKLYTPG